MPTDPVLKWLLEGDAAIRWQTLRDLKAPRKNNCMIPGVTQSMSCTISLLGRGFHILPTAYKQSCSILL
jgi:hypothetical protein